MQFELPSQGGAQEIPDKMHAHQTKTITMSPIHIHQFMQSNSFPTRRTACYKGLETPGVCPAKNANISREMMELQQYELKS
jgi:hypothetical protein